MTRTGLEQLLFSPPAALAGKRLGLLANPASVDGTLRHARDAIADRFPGRLTALFSPQHGFFAEKQDNMIESGHITDPALGIPVFSLYGTTRIPTKKMLETIDLLLVDIQDVGTRVYTFIYTIAYCMEACRDAGIPVWILDRPNPIGGSRVEGNLLETQFASFVGRYPIPMRHGLTVGEFARLANDAFGIGADLTVIPMDGWEREMDFQATKRPWVLPSPNMPTPDTALVYPGQVIWEGTNVSEARGTTRPFEMFGAPWMDPVAIASHLPEDALTGSVLRPTIFEPTSGKHARTPCRGFQIHVTDPRVYRPYYQSVCLLRAVISCHEEAFGWKQPPYEYEFEKLPMDLILGSQDLRKAIQKGVFPQHLTQSWEEECRSFTALARPHLLYPAAGDFSPRA